jgi:hypothetical protein
MLPMSIRDDEIEPHQTLTHPTGKMMKEELHDLLAKDHIRTDRTSQRPKPIQSLLSIEVDDQISKAPHITKPSPHHPIIGGAAATLVLAVALWLPDLSTGQPRQSPTPRTTRLDSAQQQVDDPPIAPDVTDLRLAPLGPPTADPRKPQPYLGHSPGMPAAVLPARQASGKLSLQWRLLDVSADGQTLDILAVSGDGTCVKSIGVQVLETRTVVELSALSSWDPTATSCPSLPVVARLLVPLGQSLGNRTLLHASVSTLWGGVPAP